MAFYEGDMALVFMVGFRVDPDHDSLGALLFVRWRSLAQDWRPPLILCIDPTHG